jgi:Zn-dependent protease
VNDVSVEQVVFQVVITIIPLILAIAVHEWAHVAMARFLGDRTGEQEGRLTLNPLAHADPVWTVAVPTYMVIAQSLGYGVPFFGAGKPAPYNPVRLDRRFFGKRIQMRTGELLVAAAGPASNVVLALVTVGVVAACLAAGVDASDPRSVVPLLLRFVWLNVSLAVFNMIPVPPLDGSKVLMSLLPRSAAAKYEAIGDQLKWGLLLLVLVAGSIVLLPFEIVKIAIYGALVSIVFPG